MYPYICYKATKDKEVFSTLTLCAKCPNEDTSFTPKRCHHTDKERGFETCVTLEELYMAWKQGYVINHIYNIIYWRESRPYLFHDLLASFAWEKIASSGFPEGCTTEEGEGGLCGFPEQGHWIYFPNFRH